MGAGRYRHALRALGFAGIALQVRPGSLHLSDKLLKGDLDSVATMRKLYYLPGVHNIIYTCIFHVMVSYLSS